MLRDNQPRAKMVRLALWLLMLAISSVTLLSLVGPLQSDWRAADSHFESGITDIIFILYGLGGFGYYALLIGSCTAFLLWLHRAYYNLHQLPAAQPRYATGWAVGAWFIPLLNLVRPYAIVREVWQQTQRAALGSVKTPATILPYWWAVLFVQVIVSYVARKSGSAFSDHPVTQDVPLATILEASAQLVTIALTQYIISRCARFEEQLVTRQLIDQLGQPVQHTPLETINQGEY